jgi:hypothetical protein
MSSAVATAASETERLLVNAALSVSAYGDLIQKGASDGVQILVAVVGSCATGAAKGVLLLLQWVCRCYKVCMATPHSTALIPCQSEHMLLRNTRMACDNDTGVYAEQCDSVALFSVLQAGANTPPITVTPTPICVVSHCTHCMH